MSLSISRRWERLRTVPGLGRDVLAIVLLVTVAIIAGLIMQSKMSATLPWSDPLILRAEFETVPGVNPQSSHKVTIAGVNVGKIVDWEATDRGTAILEFEIDEGHEIYDNAHAVLRPKNPLNDMTVEINPGGPPGEKLDQDGLIPLAQTERPVQVGEVLSHLDERTQLAVNDLLVESDVALVRAPKDLPAGLDATHSTLLKMQPVVKALETRRTKIATLVSALSNISKAVGDNDERTATLVDATQQTLSALSDNDEALRSSLKQLPGLDKDLRGAMTSTRALTGQLNPTLKNLGDAADSLPGTLSRFQDTVHEVDKTIGDAKPLVAKAQPVVADLRPLVADVDTSLGDLVPVTKSLQQDTGTLVNYQEDIRAFVYNTSSVFGAGDGPETGIIRGHLVVPLTGAGVLPGGRGGYSPGSENGIEGEN